MNLPEGVHDRVVQIHKLCMEVTELMALSEQQGAAPPMQTDEDKLNYINQGVFSIEFSEAVPHIISAWHTLDYTPEDALKAVQSSGQTIDESVAAVKRNMVNQVLKRVLEVL